MGGEDTSEVADVWAPGAEPEAPRLPATVSGPSDGLPPVTDIAQAVLDDFQQHFMGLLLLGLGFHAVILVGVVVLSVTLGLCVVPGVLMESEQLAILGTLVGTVVGTGLMFLVITPGSASTVRALGRMVVHGETPSFSGAFVYGFRDLGSLTLYGALSSFLTVLGMLLCYLPGLVVSFLLSWGFAAIALHRLGPVAAVRRSVGHVRDHPQWHLGFFGLGFCIAMLGSYVPIVGVLAYFMYLTRAYRASFPDEELQV